MLTGLREERRRRAIEAPLVLVTTRLRMLLHLIRALQTVGWGHALAMSAVDYSWSDKDWKQDAV